MYSLDVCTHHVRLWRFSWSIEDVRGKDCVEKFVEDNEDEVKRLYEMFHNNQWQSSLKYWKENMK